MKQELEDMLYECTAELNDIEARIDDLSHLDKGMRYFTNYALIKACGTVEFVYRSIVADHFSQLKNSRIDTYLDATIRKGSMSPSYNNMMKLLGQFDDQWKKDFQNTINARNDRDKLIKASDSLVNNRHSFAHGRSVSASFQQIKQYYEDVVELIRVFDSIVR